MLIFVKVSAAELAQAAEPSKKLNTEGVSLTAESTALPRARKPCIWTFKTGTCYEIAANK